MRNLLNLFSFFNKMTSVIIFSILFIVLVVSIVIAVKSEHLRKVFLYVIAVVIITIGAFSGVGLYKDITAESFVVGSLELNQSDKVFEYSTTSLVFYEDSSDYIYSKSLEETFDFNGVKNNYKMYLNDYLVVNTTESAGSIFGIVTIDFYDIDNEIECRAELKINILFYNSKTELKLTTNSSSYQYLQEYFNNNGFRLVVENGV